jgi:tRNA G18 (ribose-2'-O)-methylase SpoU
MRITTITDLSDTRLQAYVSLTEPQLRNRLEPEKGLFIAEQPKVIDRALAAHVKPFSFLIEEKWLDSMKDEFDLVDSLWGPDIPVFVGSEELLRKLTGYRLNRGALAAMHRWPLPSVEEVCRDARRVAVLENVVNHENIGAIMRSAAALDVDAVLVTPSCADPLYRRAVRVSMGTCFQVPWTRIGGDDHHNWPHPGLEQLHDLGFTTAAMALEDDSISLDELSRRTHSDEGEPDHIDKLALIFGTEGTGLLHRTIADADLTVKIPMSHDVDSLNVAASSAVAFWATRP